MLGLARRPIRLGVVMLLIMAGAIWGLGSVTQAATLTVTKIADTSDGTCNADCSLREAMPQPMLVMKSQFQAESTLGPSAWNSP